MSFPGRLARWLPMLPVLTLWTVHLYYSATLRPDVLFADDWSVFRIPGYSRAFSLGNIFGTQNDTVAAYQNLVQYLALVLFDLRFPVYIAVQNLFLLAFLVGSWRLLRSIAGPRSLAISALAALAVVPALTGTTHFQAQAMSFVHQMPMVYTTLALLCLWTPCLGRARQPLCAALLSLAAVAYISGAMYLLAASAVLVAVRALTRGRTNLPSVLSIAGAWLVFALVAGLSVALTDRSFSLLEAGTNHKNVALLLPTDARFLRFFLITVAKGWGLPASTAWGAVVLAVALAPLLWLAIIVPRRGGPVAGGELFALATPVIGAFAATAMITAGRGLLAGPDTATVIAYAIGHPYYYLHATFALPFAVVAWFRALGHLGWPTPAPLAASVVLLGGFASGAGASLADRLDYPAIFEAGAMPLRAGRICLENKVRLARASGPDVPVLCPALFPRDLRPLVQAAGAAGVAAIAGISNLPPVSPGAAEAAILAAGQEPGGRIDSLDVAGSHVRLVGLAAADDGAVAGWVAVTMPGQPMWLARVGAVPGTPAGFDIVVPLRGSPSDPGKLSAWALFIDGDGRIAQARPLVPKG
jgi:hypothetical protein